MGELKRTESGYLNISKFYSHRILVWVEGSDDRLFWGEVFPKEYKGFRVHFKLAYGSPILKYARDISEGKIIAVVALDSDYDEVKRYKPEHSMVLKTRRYSIENYLYVPEIVDELLSLKTRNRAQSNLGQRWEEHISKAIRKLVYLDFASTSYGVGQKVLGDNSARYMQTSPKTSEFSQASTRWSR